MKYKATCNGCSWASRALGFGGGHEVFQHAETHSEITGHTVRIKLKEA